MASELGTRRTRVRRDNGFEKSGRNAFRDSIVEQGGPTHIGNLEVFCVDVLDDSRASVDFRVRLYFS